MTDDSHQTQHRPVMGIGACLEGSPVRYNGQTKAPNQHVKALGEHFEMRTFCPEMGIGLGVPRPPIHLVGTPEAVRVLDVATHEHDYTEQIQDYAGTVLSMAPELCGYVLVKGSPSCGYERVKRYTPEGHSAASDQQGIFAAALHAADPLLPLEDDGRLNDPGLRESFTTRACTYHDWKTLVAEGLTAHKLIGFYSRYKYLVMAHHVPSYKALGPMLANAGKEDLDELSGHFINEVMSGLRHRATRRSHSNVLFHLSGYLKRTISSAERQRLAGLIDSYRTGLVPLVVPLTMLKHHFANNPNAYVEQQTFLSPYPEELGLRNLV